MAEETDIQLAADLAAFFSKAKHNKIVSVIKVPTERLQRIQGAITGTVRHSGGEVLWGCPTRAMQHIEQHQSDNALSSLSERIVK